MNIKRTSRRCAKLCACRARSAYSCRLLRLTSAASTAHPSGAARHKQHTVRAPRNTQHATHGAMTASACSTLCLLGPFVLNERVQGTAARSQNLNSASILVNENEGRPRSQSLRSLSLCAITACCDWGPIVENKWFQWGLVTRDYRNTQAFTFVISAT